MTTESKKKKTVSVKHMTLIGLMAALLCILSPWSLILPGLVPISLATLVIYFSLYVLGMKRALLSCIIYLFIGLIGVPVFSGFGSGPGKLFGPTGGYLIGYLFLAIIAGLFIDKWTSNYVMCILGMVLGTALCYLVGTAWLAYQNHLTFMVALSAGVLPFIPGDAAKIVLALILGPVIRKRLIKADLF